MEQAVSFAATNLNRGAFSHFWLIALFRFGGDPKRNHQERRNHNGKSNERQSVQRRRDHHPRSIAGREMGEEHLPEDRWKADAVMIGLVPSFTIQRI